MTGSTAGEAGGTAGDGAGDGDPRIAALAAGLDRVGRQVRALGGTVNDLAGTVDRLTEQPGAGPPAPVPSPLLDPGGVDAPGLLGWLDQVYLAYDGAALGPCWAYHPGVVAELEWLRLAYDTAHASGDPARVGDWHDRYRPGVVRRVREALRGCHIDDHGPEGARAQGTPAAPLSGALSDVLDARAAGAPAPHPSAEQTEQARRLDERSRR